LRTAAFPWEPDRGARLRRAVEVSQRSAVAQAICQVVCLHGPICGQAIPMPYPRLAGTLHIRAVVGPAELALHHALAQAQPGAEDIHP